MSLNTIPPNFLRSRVPSGKRMSGPNVETILRNAGVPGRTTSRAMMSASITGTRWDLRREETEDLPVAIPPVNPTTIYTPRLFMG